MSIVDVNPTEEGFLQRALDTVRARTDRLVRVCPGPNGHGYPLLDWMLSPLPETCERENLGLVIDYQGAAIPWELVIPFARAYPGLPMILVGASGQSLSVIPAALEVAANLIVELPDASDRPTVERLVGRFGSHRVTVSASTIVPDAWREAHL
ncbi:MAG: hypothetical protein M3Z11_04980 [Candidatus Dormibacteraeota bacterium]|nr:hypothetical protein [Candidatus Dormibacteraeota bacterium]